MSGMWIDLYVILLCGLLGLLVGSFLNVVAIRMPRGRSVATPPSHCPQCGHRLSPLDLIPVASYVLLRRRCRYCHSPISPAYMLGELATGACFAVVGWQLGIVPELAVGLLFVSILVVAAITDLREWIIPDKLIGFALVSGALFRFISHPLPLWNYWAAFAAGGLALYGLAWFGWKVYKKDVMGGGDIKLMAVIGLFTGLQGSVIAILAASVTGLVLIGGRSLIGTYKRGDAIPFGPFLAFGGIIGYLWGEPLAASYQLWLLSLLELE